MSGRFPRLGAWVLASRPKTLPAAVAPIFVGAAIAYSHDSFHAVAVVVAAVAALLLQILVNVANDYFDHIRGIDGGDRIGPTRAASAGLISLRGMRGGMTILIALIIVTGIYPAVRGGIPTVIIGVAAILSALGYSAGPLPFSSNGLGDLFVFGFFGPVAVCGAYYLQALELQWSVIAASIPIGTLITAVLVVNNYRDLDSDRVAGKTTLAGLLGPAGTRAEFVILLAVGYLMVPVLALIFRSPFVLLSLVTVPLAIRVVRDINGRANGRELNRTLAATALLALVYAIMLSAGIVAATRL